MDELKLLIEMVAGLPSLAVWVLVGYLAYKIAVVGSIYGLLRYAIGRLHDWRTRPPPPAPPVELKLGGRCINDAVAEDLRSVLCGIGSSTGYIHASDVTALRRAIEASKAKQ